MYYWHRHFNHARNKPLTRPIGIKQLQAWKPLPIQSLSQHQTPTYVQQTTSHYNSAIEYAIVRCRGPLICELSQLPMTDGRQLTRRRPSCVQQDTTTRVTVTRKVAKLVEKGAPCLPSAKGKPRGGTAW
jgi:hypothetical protein